MPQYLLRVEGVNLANSIDDTDDLSTRRGGGLMTLQGPQELTSLAGVHLEKIMTGASIGLFQFESTPDKSLEVEQAARKYFKDKFPYLTFVANVVERTNSDSYDEQLATASNRWSQMQSLTLSVEGAFEKGEKPCAYDLIRAGVTPARAPNAPLVSWAVAERQEYGRDKRQDFYSDELGEKLYLELTNAVEEKRRVILFTDSVADIAARKDDDPLKDKLAFFYVDGNKFGESARDILKKEGLEASTQWSEGIKKHHRKLLQDLLTLVGGSDDWKTPDKRFRLETLLWGGDEIIWVVPAWKGWELAKWFFSQEHTVNGTPVSYSGALLFHRAKAPIKNIKDLAYRVADLAKKFGVKGEKHALGYEVLESFDDIFGDVQKYRSRWVPPSAIPKDEKGENLDALVVDPKQLFDCWKPLLQVANHPQFPVRQLYRLCKLWRNGEDPESRDFKDCVTRLTKEEGLREPMSQILAAFGNSPIAYLHLLQMLPYLPEMPKEAQA